MSVFSRIRDVYRRHWLILTALLTIEAGINSYSIYGAFKQHRSPIEIRSETYNYIFENSESAISKQIMVLYNNKYEREYKAGKNQVGIGDISKSLNHPKTVSSLDEMIRKDYANKLTEIPFQVRLDYDRDNLPFLIFYEQKNTLNERISHMLLEYVNNPDFILYFMKEGKDHYQTITHIDEDLYKRILRLLEGNFPVKNPELDVSTVRRSVARNVVDLYVSSSDNFAIGDEKMLKDFYFSNFLKFSGRFVGEGHIHLRSIDNPKPSPHDFNDTKRQRQVIFADTFEGMKVYVLEKGTQNVLNMTAFPKR